MPAERLEMRRVREILRYRFEQGLGHKSIAVRVGAAPSTVRETLRRATVAGLSWPLDDDVSDAVLEAALYKAAGKVGQFKVIVMSRVFRPPQNDRPCVFFPHMWRTQFAPVASPLLAFPPSELRTEISPAR